MKTTTCRHFSGLINKVCKLGIEYSTVARPSGIRDTPMYGQCYPCIAFGLPLAEEIIRDLQTACAHSSFLTPEEEKADEERFRRKLAAWGEKIANNICPHCDQPMTKRQVSRCVYASPCGHRLYQGKLTKEQSSAKAIPKP